MHAVLNTQHVGGEYASRDGGGLVDTAGQKAVGVANGEGVTAVGGVCVCCEGDAGVEKTALELRGVGGHDGRGQLAMVTHQYGTAMRSQTLKPYQSLGQSGLCMRGG